MIIFKRYISIRLSGRKAALFPRSLNVLAELAKIILICEFQFLVKFWKRKSEGEDRTHDLVAGKHKKIQAPARVRTHDLGKQ